jgi:hypothetical protein
VSGSDLRRSGMKISGSLCPLPLLLALVSPAGALLANILQRSAQAGTRAPRVVPFERDGCWEATCTGVRLGSDLEGAPVAASLIARRFVPVVRRASSGRGPLDWFLPPKISTGAPAILRDVYALVSGWLCPSACTAVRYAWSRSSNSSAVMLLITVP